MSRLTRWRRATCRRGLCGGRSHHRPFEPELLSPKRLGVNESRCSKGASARQRWRTSVSKRWSFALASVMITLSVAACGSPGQPGAPAGDNGTAGASGGSGAPYKVGLVYSKSGPLASYGKQYRQGLTAGIDYATKGTGAVAGRTDPDHRAGRRRRPGQGRRVGHRPHRSGQHDHRRLDLERRGAAGGAAGEGQQGPLHLGSGRRRRRHGCQPLHLPVGTPDLPGRRDGREHAGRRQGQEGHGSRAGQRLRQGQRRSRHGGPRRQGRRRSARSRSRRPRPT